MTATPSSNQSGKRKEPTPDEGVVSEEHLDKKQKTNGSSSVCLFSFYCFF
jgi:hypothetical protein